MTENPFEQAMNAVMVDGDSWMPHKEPGQPPVIVGRYVRSGVTADSGYGTSEVKTLREPDGHEWTLRLYGKVLAREWTEADPEIGDVVAVRYKGEEQTRDGTTFRNYRVVVIADESERPAAVPAEPDAPSQSSADEPLKLHERAERLSERYHGDEDDEIPF